MGVFHYNQSSVDMSRQTLERFSTVKSGDLVAERHGSDEIRPPFFVCVKLTMSDRRFNEFRDDVEGWPSPPFKQRRHVTQEGVVDFMLLVGPAGSRKLLTPWTTARFLDLMYVVVARAEDMV